MKIDLRFLIGWFVFGVVIGAVASQLSTGFGLAFPATDAFLATSLVAIGFAIYGATYPIFRYRNQLEKTQKKNVKRPDPLLSFRLLVLARAVMITGLGFMGWHLGQLIWLWLFSIAPSGLILPTLVGLAAALLLYLGGLGAEYNCRLPKDPDGETA
jgi:cytochrome bd-type quinol oxidase subunit 2